MTSGFLEGVNPVFLICTFFLVMERSVYMEKSQNKMATSPINKLFWKMVLPMIISMVLQALYNVVDSIFVANVDGVGAIANQALTYAFPIQILIIAIGVGTGVGLNALLSKSFDEGNYDKVNKTAGNGIILSILI